MIQDMRNKSKASNQTSHNFINTWTVVVVMEYRNTSLAFHADANMISMHKKKRGRRQG